MDWHADVLGIQRVTTDDKWKKRWGATDATWKGSKIIGYHDFGSLFNQPLQLGGPAGGGNRAVQVAGWNGHTCECVQLKSHEQGGPARMCMHRQLDCEWSCTCMHIHIGPPLAQIELHGRVHWPTTHVARLQIDHGPVVGHILGVGDPWFKKTWHQYSPTLIPILQHCLRRWRSWLI